MDSRANPLVWTKWQWRGLVALMLVLAAIDATASLSHIARAAGLLRDWPIEGYLAVDIPAGTPAGWFRVIEAPPGKAAARAGLRAGDLVRSDVPLVAPGVVLAPGVQLPLTVDRQGSRFAAELVVPEQPSALGAVVFISQGVAGLVSAALGMLLLLLRGKRNRLAAMLGMLLLCLGWSTGGYGMVWAPAPFVYLVARLFSTVAAAGICLFLPLTGLAVAGTPRNSNEYRIVRATALVLAAITGTLSLAVAIPLPVPQLAGIAPWTLLAALLCFGSIARKYRDNDAPARNRIKIILVAFASYLVSMVLFFVFIASGQDPAEVWSIWASTLFGLVGPALLSYAVLRQHLFDLNFVLNRTLVYGAVSFILLTAFGIAEWGVERLLPESWHANGPLVSALIALALFLSFHRLRDWVERHVERLLFSKWHRNEATLRRFIAAADHFGSSAALQKGFAAELTRFADGAGAALYARAESGGYELHAGKLAKAARHYADDDRALALMRAERQPVHLEAAHSALPGVLALPMIDQGVLAGFALLGAKPDGTHYRPDEVELLGWAAQQVGFAAQAQHMRRLEGTIADLRAQLARPARRAG